jgi:hypothetical protein
VHDWVAGFERFWNESFDRLAEHSETMAAPGGAAGAASGAA